MDFTIKKYKQLLLALQSQGYFFKTFEEFIIKPKDKVVVLRHDVDRLPENAVIMAEIEHELGIRASYYYRIVKESNVPELIKVVAGLGHEIGYHYEDLSLTKGNKDKAILSFEKNLKYYRQFYNVSTACMHGSPLSKWDNRKIWEKYDYREYGIIAEPYFDVDYSKVFYITDTGRAWNKKNVNVRDIVKSGFDIQIKGTSHLIELFEKNNMPAKIIINTHPHRWFDPGFGWAKELVVQNLKNTIKGFIVLINER